MAGWIVWPTKVPSWRIDLLVYLFWVTRRTYIHLPIHPEICTRFNSLRSTRIRGASTRTTDSPLRSRRIDTSQIPQRISTSTMDFLRTVLLHRRHMRIRPTILSPGKTLPTSSVRYVPSSTHVRPSADICKLCETLLEPGPGPKVCMHCEGAARRLEKAKWSKCTVSATRMNVARICASAD